MIARFDRYLGRATLSSYGAALAFMLFLVILVDMLLNLGDYLEAGDARSIGLGELLLELAGYYARLVPLLFVTIAPFVTVIACMFTVTWFMGRNEVGPMVFTGQSVFRVLRPVFVVALLSGAGMAACWEFVLPQLLDKIHQARAQLGDGDDAYTKVRVRIPDGPELMADRFEPGARRMQYPVVFNPGSMAGDAVVVTADEAVWDEDRQDWRLVEGLRRSPSRAEDVEWLDFPELTPELVWRSGRQAREADELSYSDLLDQQRRNPNRPGFQLAFHRHIAFPLANLVLLLLSVPFAISWDRGSKMLRVVFAVGVCALYLVVDLSCQSLGYRGDLDPVVAAWVPAILFGSLGVVMFTGVRT